MTDSRSGNVVVFNGEIYNHLALRAQIQDGSSKSWKGSSDTETLLAAYRFWGRDMLKRLKGMFAFALYDALRQELFLARDRFGIKPFYYKSTDSFFQAASEIRGLGALSTRRPPARAVAGYLSFGACLEEDLLFPEIKALPAGHWMTVSTETFAHQIGCYWPQVRRMRSTEAEPARKVRALLEAAIEQHLLADVPVATFLSGGIDSSVVTMIAARKTSNKLQTFSVGFHEAAFDETAIAQEVARRCGAEHTRIVLDEDETIVAVRDAVEKMDLPSVDALNTYIVSKQVAKYGIKVALSGLGGDELFGGYPSFRDVPRLAWLASLPVWVRRSLAPLGGAGQRLAELPAKNTAALTNWRRRFWTDAMLEQAGLPKVTPPSDSTPDLPDEFARISWTELSRYMRHMLLRDSDQMSMAVSLELRVPFLDHELVEFVLGLPGAAKTRGRAVKGLLVEACRDLLPLSVYNRPKMGFALPMDTWMRGPLREFVTTGFREATLHCGLALPAVETMKQQFEERRVHWTRVWSLAVLGHYLKKIGREPCGEDAEEQSVLCESFGQSVR